MRKIKRQIYFYDIELQTYDKEKNFFLLSKDFKKDIQELFCSFEKLPFDKEHLDYSMYLKKANGTYDFVEIDTINDNYIEGKLINADDTGLTRYEENGKIKFLKDTISSTASIAEVSHFVIFLDMKIMAFEYNAKSSHSPSLANYIKTKLELKYWIEFKNLLNKNKQKKFNSLQQVRSFKFTTSSKFLLSEQASNKGFFKAASAALDLTKRTTDVEQTITIEIKPNRITKESKQPYYDAEELKNSINELKIEDEDTEKYFKLDIVGINELNEQISVNYSKDILTTEITLEPDQIESENFYEKIKEAYTNIYNKYIK